jgi:hypothetical protein
MMPRLHPGDIVVARPVDTPQLHPGQVLLFDDPDHAGRLRLHRYLQPATTGMITTKGDANPTADSSAVDLKTVHGVGYLRVPYLGLPILWLRTGAWPATTLVGIALLAAGIGYRDGDLSPGEGRTDPVSRLLFNVLGMVAESEADLIRARTREGMAIARAAGRLKGRSRKLNKTQEEHLISLYRAGTYNTSEIAKLSDVARLTVFRAIHRAEQS